MSKDSYLGHILERFSGDFSAVVDCDSGWWQLVFDCDAEMSRIDPNYTIFQIKEKFGQLRYYFQTTDPEVLGSMNSVVRHYETLSVHVCEKTGKPGQLMKKDGVYKTLCDAFMAEGWKPVKESAVSLKHIQGD